MRGLCFELGLGLGLGLVKLIYRTGGLGGLPPGLELVLGKLRYRTEVRGKQKLYTRTF